MDGAGGGTDLAGEDEALRSRCDPLLGFDLPLDHTHRLRRVAGHPHRLPRGELEENLRRHRGAAVLSLASRPGLCGSKGGDWRGACCSSMT